MVRAQGPAFATSAWGTRPRPMIQDSVNQALTPAIRTRRVVLGTGALAAVGETYRERSGGRSAVVVADSTTFEVAGRVVERGLRAAGVAVRGSVVFPSEPRLLPDQQHLSELERTLSASDAVPVAVGSGTVNDLTKLASHHTGRPYLVVATAASMDGYASFGAAITRDGFKATFPCPAPVAIVADVGILAAAPLAMTAAGFGDVLGKLTAGADWLVADALCVEPLHQDVWSLAQGAMRASIVDAEALGGGSLPAVERLFAALVLSGISMQQAQSSRPASGSEHQLSHLWEMRGLGHGGADSSHGFKVGIGTLAVAALYEHLLQYSFEGLDVEARVAAWPTVEVIEQEVRRAHYDPRQADHAVRESRAKHPLPVTLRARLETVRALWPALRLRLREHLLPVPEVRRLLTAAGCPAHPAQIGLTVQQLRASYAAARQIRRRYTVLDLAVETGVLDACLDALLSSEDSSDKMAGGKT